MFCKLLLRVTMLLLLLHCSSSLTNDHVGVLVIDLSSCIIHVHLVSHQQASAGCVKMKPWVWNFMAHTVE